MWINSRQRDQLKNKAFCMSLALSWPQIQQLKAVDGPSTHAAKPHPDAHLTEEHLPEGATPIIRQLLNSEVVCPGIEAMLAEIVH